MIKVLIADDHPIVRQGLRQILASIPDMEVAGEAVNSQEALERILQTTADNIAAFAAVTDKPVVYLAQLM